MTHDSFHAKAAVMTAHWSSSFCFYFHKLVYLPVATRVRLFELRLPELIMVQRQ